MKPIEPDPVIKETQELLTARGFNPGAIDGWMGRKTKAAVIAYQETHPNLDNDGILGPATLAQLRRDAMVVQETIAGSGRVGGLGLLSFFTGLPWGWIFGAGLTVLGIWLVLRYRDVIARRGCSLFKRKVV